MGLDGALSSLCFEKQSVLFIFDLFSSLLNSLKRFRVAFFLLVVCEKTFFILLVCCVALSSLKIYFYNGNHIQTQVLHRFGLQASTQVRILYLNSIRNPGLRPSSNPGSTHIQFQIQPDIQPGIEPWFRCKVQHRFRNLLMRTHKIGIPGVTWVRASPLGPARVHRTSRPSML